MSAHPRIERLMRKGIALLQEERQAILQADYEALETLNLRKEAIATEINGMIGRLSEQGRIAPAARQQLQGLLEILARRAAENQSLLVAASDGVAEARRRMEIVLHAEPKMGVYDARGAWLPGDSTGERSFKF